MYALDWRQYMPDIARFGVIDPFSAVIPGVTPYRFAFNNPIYFSDPSGLFEETNILATCPTCPNTPKYQPFIDDPNNTYVYDPKTGKVEKEIQIQEVVLTGKKKDDTIDNLNLANDRVGDFGTILASRANQGGSVGLWTSTIKNRQFDGIAYNRLNVKYYKNNWTGGSRAGIKTMNVSKFLKKGSVVGAVVLGAVEVGQGVADDYNDYETKGETNGKNTAVAAGSVAGGVVGGVAGAKAGAVVGAAIGVWFGGVGAAPGALIGGIIGGAVGSWGGSELGEAGVEQIYK